MTDTTAAGSYNYAHSYAVSAACLAEAQVDATHRAVSVRMLYFQAPELHSRSVLLAKGVGEDD